MNPIDPLAWAVIWIAVGCAFLALEVFIPSGGILSFLAILAFLGGVWVAFSRDLTTGLAFTAITLFVAPLVIGLAFKVWPHTPMGRAFLGELAAPERTQVDDPRKALVGRPGIAQSKMLPSGSVLVDGQLLDAVTQGIAIDRGDAIIVQEVRGNRVVVRPASPTDRAGMVGDAAPENSADILSKPLEEFGLDALEEPLS